MQLAFLVEKIVDIYFKMKYFWLNIFRNLPVPRSFFWNSRSISSEEKGSALRLLFPSPCDFRSFLLAVNTSLQWWNSLSWRIFVPFFSIKYRLTDDYIAFKLSGSYFSLILQTNQILLGTDQAPPPVCPQLPSAHCPHAATLIIFSCHFLFSFLYYCFSFHQ